MKAAVSRDGEGKKALFEIVSEGSYPVEVRDGEYLTVENACLQPAGLGAPETENCGWFAAKVGRELKPGTYQLFAADEEISGYYAVYRTARYMENEKMQSDFFETSIFVFLKRERTSSQKTAISRSDRKTAGTKRRHTACLESV